MTVNLILKFIIRFHCYVRLDHHFHSRSITFFFGRQTVKEHKVTGPFHSKESIKAHPKNSAHTNFLIGFPVTWTIDLLEDN